uniref:Uncharacterized protein n=1 Tax=Oryza barthii TaxID=65489 RepID=A0A0D3FEQ6_9ORYZ
MAQSLPYSPATPPLQFEMNREIAIPDMRNEAAKHRSEVVAPSSDTARTHSTFPKTSYATVPLATGEQCLVFGFKEQKNIQEDKTKFSI